MQPDYWEKNGIEKPEQIIVCAACRCGEVIFCGARHWDMVMHSQAVVAGHTDHAPPGEEGFIDQFGDFITRKHALEIVKRNGQRFLSVENGSDSELYSEGLY